MARENITIEKYSWRVEVCRDFQDGQYWWASYVGKRKNDNADDDFSGWFRDDEIGSLLSWVWSRVPQSVFNEVEYYVESIS